MGLSLKSLGKKITDIAGGVERQINPLDSGLSYKTKVAAPQQRQQSAVQQAVNLGRPIVHPFSTIGSAVVHTPQAIYREVQNKPINDIQKKIFGTTDSGSIGKQIVGDIGQIGLTVAAPGLTRGIEAGVGRVLPTKVLPKVISNAGVGGAFNATAAASQGADAKETLKSAALGAAIGGGLPVAGVAVKGGAKVAAKTAQAIDRKAIAAAQKNPAGEIGSVGLNVNKPAVRQKQPAEIDAAYRQAQNQREQLYSQPAGQKARRTTGRNLYDPRNVEQGLDNAEFKRQRAAGQTLPGQSDLLSEQSLAAQRGRIQNPYRAAETRNKTRYATDNGEYSVNDIIKHYGKEGGQKARDFENYRIYKDEMERLANGHDNTLGLDPRVMDGYVKAYEASNPVARSHNQALRQASLEGLAERSAAGIDDPELLARAQQFQHYNPRQAVDPEELIRPKMTGGVRSGAKGTQARSETAGGPVRSPLSLFRQRNQELEKALAEQRYGTELRRRGQEGNLPGYREVINAEDVSTRKQLLAAAKEAAAPIRKNATRAANVRADLRNSVVLKGGAEYKAAAKAKQLLRKQVQDPDARAAIDSMSRKDLVDTFKYLVDEGTPNVERIRTNLIKRSRNHQNLVSELDNLKTQIKQDQQEASALRSGASEFTQRNERGVQTYSYKVDGEAGKFEIPADLAESLSKQNELMNESLIERGLKPIATAQKLTWTGALQPAFKVWNVLVKNPLLMYRNADGFSGIRPEALGSVARNVVNTPKMAQFRRDMQSRNMAYENAFQTRNVHQVAADEIAARANLKEFFIRNPVKTMGDLWRGLNQGLASVDNSQRYAVAYGAYKRAKGLGFSDKQALDVAAEAPGKVFGDFDRVTRLAQNLEVLIPYSGATQAGGRALIRASKTKPISTTAKDVTLLGGMAALTAYSLSNSSDYYKDMIDSGKRYVLDNNWTIVLPWASRDSDGKWKGVVQIPLTPDFRPANRAAWQSVYNHTQGKNLNPGMIAGEVFNQLTGDSANQVYADEKTNNRKNLVNGVLPSSPLVNVGKTLAGVNTYTGDPLANEFMASKPRTEQFTDNTSPGAKTASKRLGGLLTPQQVDQLYGQIGTTGDILQNKDGAGAGGISIAAIKKPLQPGKGQSDKSKSGAAYYQDLNAVKSTLKNEDDFRAFQSITGKNTVKTLDDSAARAKELLARPDVLKAMSALDSKKRSRGETGDPFFGLTSEQQQKVLRYRGAKDLNSAKQAYDKNGNPLYTALGLDEKWYDDYRTAEDSYYAAINDKNSANSDNTILTYSGAKKPKASPELQAKLDYYYTIPSGTGARSAFLKSNPDVLGYWSDSNSFTDAERVALGLKTSDALPGGSSNNGYGGGSGSGSPDLNPYKYAISLNAGGDIKKPKVKSTTPSRTKARVASKTGGAPKVTIKKSKV